MGRSGATVLGVLLRVLLATGSLAAQAPTLTFEPGAWELGTISGDDTRTLAAKVTNTGTAPATVTFVPACDCLTVEPARQVVKPGDAAVFTLSFDPEGYAGSVVLDFLVRTDVPGLEKALFAVTAVVEGSPVVEAPAPPAPAATDRGLELLFYYTPGCRTCERLLDELGSSLGRATGAPVRFVRRNILDPSVYEEYTALLASLGQTERAFPALVVRGAVLQGEREIRAGAQTALAGSPRAGSHAPPPGEGGGVDLRVLPIAAAGLLDGVNPCAFSTLVFLVSSLLVAGRGRREVLVVGLLFAAGVFVTYYAVGLGAFSALRAASGFPLVATLLRWVLFAALLVLAGLSVYDFFLARSGRPGRMLLQLPNALKKQIHRTIRGGVRAAAMGAGAAAMGALVSLFELACTGQVYLPAIAYMVRSGVGAAAYLYLLVYNLGFISPLLAVFVLAWLGLSSRRLAGIVASSVGAVKLGLAGLFVLMAILTALS